jgi:CO dehydrogenase/acetyl-CoA synthase epsilon subunit
MKQRSPDHGNKIMTKQELKRIISEAVKKQLREQNFKQSHKKLFLEKLKGFLQDASRQDYGGIDQYDVEPILSLVEKYIDQSS